MIRQPSVLNPPPDERVRTIDVLPQLCIASAACSAVIVEFTVPQIVKLSQMSTIPLPAAPFQTRLLIMGRALAPQTAITCLQFAAVRELRDVEAGVAAVQLLWGGDQGLVRARLTSGAGRRVQVMEVPPRPLAGPLRPIRR